MGLKDFETLSPDEFEAVCKAYGENRQSEYRDAWERMRMEATICIQPHLRKKVTPEKLLPFPWERKEVKQVSKEEALERFERIMAKQH